MKTPKSSRATCKLQAPTLEGVGSTSRYACAHSALQTCRPVGTLPAAAFTPHAHPRTLCMWSHTPTLIGYTCVLQEVNGIIPGYGGHIPAARDEVGMSAVGNVPLYGAKAQSPMGHPSLGGGIIGGKVRFEGMTAGMTDNRKEYKDVSTGVLPGYAGFVPAARDKYGGTYRGGGRLTEREY